MKSDGTRHSLADIYHERTEFDFVGRSWRWALISGTLVLVSLIALFTNGLNLGLDFEGGTSWIVTVDGKTPKVSEANDALSGSDIGSAKVQVLGGRIVRVEAKTADPDKQLAVAAVLAEYAGVDVDSVSVSTVGPTWGAQVTRRAFIALGVFFLLVAIVLALLFEWRMALAAIIAVLHDVIITVGVYALFGFEVTPATIVAFLTILGFSLYDTVVVFDKIKENRAILGSTRAPTYPAMVNLSMNQVLMRSLNTSFIAVLPVAALLLVGVFALGAQSLFDFSLALFVGLLTGAYSSIFVATPIVNWLQARRPENQALRERAERAPVAVAVAADTSEATGTGSGATLAPRPRKRKR
jgi:preprotein translocase subunit SecF